MPYQNQKQIYALLDERALLERVKDAQRMIQAGQENAAHWLQVQKDLLEELAKRNTENRKKAEGKGK